MKVVIPFSYFYPETCAGIFIVDDLMRKLAEHGDDAVLYVPTPTRAVKDGAEWSRDEFLCGGRIHVHRFRMYGEGKNPILRALRYCFCEVVYLHHLLWDKYDVAFIDSTPPIQGLKLPIVKLFRHKPVVYNAQDLFPDSLMGAGLAKRNGLLWKIGAWVANVAFGNSDKIIAISGDIKRNLIAKGVPESKIEVIYNWIDEDAVVPVAKADNPLFEEFGLSRGKFNVVYAGNLGNAQNIDVIIDAAELLKDKGEIEFIIFGTGSLKDQFVQKAADMGLDNVKFFPLQPMERVAQVYGLGDICVVSCKPGFGGAAMPSKTMSILSAGRPVLASFDKGELTDILSENNCGVSVPAGDARAFADAVGDLAQDRLKCDEMGHNGRELILRKFTREVGTKRYVDVIKSVSGERV